jgi:large subunit ribosomal protein L33
MRDFVRLMCTEKGCGSMYFTTKNKKTQTKKIELSKYCKFCRKHTNHKEAK